MRYRIGNSNESRDNVRNLYQTILNRAPDTDGFQYWINALSNGSTFTQVRNSFIEAKKAQIGSSNPLIKTPIKLPQTGGDSSNAGSSGSGLPDGEGVINYMANQFANNPSSSMVSVMSTLNSIASGNDSIFNNMDPLSRFLATPIINFIKEGSKLAAYAIWAGLVKTGGVWDQKKMVKWLSNDQNWVQDKLTGKSFKFEAWSNMHYGYVGRIAGFSEWELLNGAGLAQTMTNGLGNIPSEIVSVVQSLKYRGIDLLSLSQLKRLFSNLHDVIYKSNKNANIFDLSSIDDSDDQMAIKGGFDLYNHFSQGISKTAFISEIRYHSKLNEAYGLPPQK